MPHNHGQETQAPSPFEELIRPQSAFQQNLSQATMNYLRQLQGLVGPVTPGTVVNRLEQSALSATIQPAGHQTLAFRIENRQRVHSMITPMITPLVSDTGATWFAESVFDPPMALLATDETVEFTLRIAAPKDMPLGVYRDAILIYGCADGVLPLEVVVAAKQAAQPKPAAKKAARPKPAAKEAARSKTAAKEPTEAAARASKTSAGAGARKTRAKKKTS